MLLVAAPNVRGEEAPSAADWLASGHHKKRIGIALMATGGALAVVGTGLMIGGAWDHDDHACHGYDGYYYDRYGYGYAHCGNTALTIAGATTTALGIGTIIPGIFVYANGGAEIDEGRRLARQCGAFCWEGWELRRSP